MEMIREGYKETEIGVIPEDWEVKMLGEIFKVSSGNSLSQKNIVIGDYPVYGGNGINGYHNQFEFKSSQLVIGRVGAYCGCIHMTQPKSWITDNALYVKEKKEKYVDEFMFYKLTHLNLNKFANHNAQPVISGEKIYPILIAFPPLPEQQRIADILSTTDAHIDKLDKIIDDYQLLKKGMMKKLLTEGIGHTEFKETEIGRIPKEWDILTVSKLGTFKKGKGISKSEVKSYGIQCIRYGEIYTSYDHFVRETTSFINEESAKLSELIRNGDIVFAGSGETVEDIGKAVTYLGDKPCYVGGDTIIMHPNDTIDSMFLTYYLSSTQVKKQMKKLGQGSSIIHIYLEGIKKILIAVPSIDEQCLIGSLFETIDNRIHLFKESKQEFIQLKKSLMEKLLTGRIRVV